MSKISSWQVMLQAGRAMLITFRRTFGIGSGLAQHTSDRHLSPKGATPHAADAPVSPTQTWDGGTIARGPLASFRGQPSLSVDDEGNTRCTACAACVNACPTGCIRVVPKGTCPELVKGSTIQLQVDLRRCMYCGLCASVCPVQAIELLAVNTIEPASPIEAHASADSQREG